MQTPITETKIVKKPVVEQKVNQPSLSEIVNRRSSTPTKTTYI
jgi:hypothetical protein